MKKLLIAILFCYLGCCVAADAADDWDIVSDVVRLHSEVPSEAAFHGADQIIWRDAMLFTLVSDGTKMVRSRTLTYVSANNTSSLPSVSIRYPDIDNSAVEITVSSIVDERTGAVISQIPWRHIDRNGIKYVEFSIPNSVRGHLIAIEYVSISPMQYYMDALVEMVGRYPIWEKSVEVELPEDIPFFWEASRMGAPAREKLGNGTERFSWTKLNISAQEDSGMIYRPPTAVLFSLQKGLGGILKKYSDTYAGLKLPKQLNSISRSSSLNAIGKDLHKYMQDRMAKDQNESDKRMIRTANIASEKDLSVWEATLATGKLLSSAGFDVKVYWSQRIPVGQSGPGSAEVWDEPVLVVDQTGSGNNIFYTASQSVPWGKIDFNLYGRYLFRINEGEIERISVPFGSTSENAIQQNWRMTMSESGDASGKFDMTFSGAWVDLLGLNGAETPDAVMGAFERDMNLSIPGLDISLVSTKRTASSLKLSFNVSARLGIASGNDLLFRLPAVLPKQIAELAVDEWEGNMRFPFLVEQNATITTPPGYKALALPGRIQLSSSGSTVDIVVEHWPKRRRAEASFKWSVKKIGIDEMFRKTITEHARRSIDWSRTQLPIRK